MNTTAHTQTPEAEAQTTSRVPPLNNPQGVDSQDLYQRITDRILEVMEQVEAGGLKLWDGQQSLPMNLATGKPYTGINVLILWGASLRGGFSSNYWLTYKQAAALGGQVRKGEKSELCVFYKPWETVKENEAGETEAKRGAVLKSFRVFNLDQIDGIEPPQGPKRGTFSPIEQAEQILKDSGAVIEIGGSRAFYRPSTDTVHLPERERFTSTENFYAVALHELTHWTGHRSRLARDFSGRFGDEAYAFEELIAELGSAFINAELGIIGATLENHASYLKSWIRVLKSDKKAILTAAAQAEKARAYILGRLAPSLNPDA